MRCHNCDDELNDDEVRWAFEEPYCEACFDHMFNYCSRCDGVIYRDGARYDDEGDPFCSECYESNFDDTYPNDPEVIDEDRKFIITLCRQSIRGVVIPKRLININKDDSFLPEIKSLVGYVEKPLYLFGLQDRDEYQISCSEDMLNQLSTVVAVEPGIKVVVTSGVRRLGVSYNLRKNKRLFVLRLIGSLCYDIDKKMILAFDNKEGLCVA